MTNILEMDAILARDEEGNLIEPDWPEADVIVGNLPFLGGKRMRKELGDEYVDNLFRLYRDRLPREVDLVCYWFEKARIQIREKEASRVGLLATNALRSGANRKVLARIRENGDIFFAESDRPWILNGAAVRISMVGFDSGAETYRTLDGKPVERIHSNLTGDLDLTVARPLLENLSIAFMGDTKGGPFDITNDVANEMLPLPNPNGRPNADVVRPWVNGFDITRRPRDMYIIDFGIKMSLEESALYEAPFEYVNEHVRPKREKSRTTRSEWWLHERPRVDMREALAGLSRFVCTATTAKYRLFVWFDGITLADHQTIAFAREDDYFFGILHSRIHEVWSLNTGSTLEDRPRYTPTTCFETFPFPEPTEEQRTEISAVAQRLDELRRNWLNPEGVSEAELKKRTLTNLYNVRPVWLQNVHEKLDRAVFAAYGWPPSLTDEAILKNLLALNLERSS
jgi:type II restriction/modification system DNA methylase subunit YeeA